jgi:hypothetical protein
MLQAGIRRGQELLAKAKVIEAADIARGKAEEARKTVSEMPPLGVRMAEAVAAFLAVYGEYLEASGRLERLGYSPWPHLGSQLTGVLGTTLQKAGFDHLDMHHGFWPGRTFETLFQDLEQVIKNKTAPAIGDVAEAPAPVIEEALEVERPHEGDPCMTVERTNSILDAWNASRSAA